MNPTDRRERILALWEGDAVQSVRNLWTQFAEITDDVALVEAIFVAGRADRGVEVEPETLDRMYQVARREY